MHFKYLHIPISLQLKHKLFGATSLQLVFCWLVVRRENTSFVPCETSCLDKIWWLKFLIPHLDSPLRIEKAKLWANLTYIRHIHSILVLCENMGGILPCRVHSWKVRATDKRVLKSITQFAHFFIIFPKIPPSFCSYIFTHTYMYLFRQKDKHGK